MTLTNFIADAQKRIDQLFQFYLTESSHPSLTLQKAMAYAVNNGGKRIRPTLVYLCGRALEATWENLDAPACAIELMHAYSLIHDDLPAMDNADLRRGKPSCHKAFDEAIAILAGDALQTVSFEMIATHPSSLTAEQRLKMIQILSHASGMDGMAGGQALDLAKIDSLESLTRMYKLKTGALLTACVKLGETAANSPNTSLQKFADCIGLAFQIQDDILDLEGVTETIGKPQGIDQINSKLTYPVLLGIDESRQKVDDLFAEALSSIEFLGKKGQLLHDFAQFILMRRF